MNSSIYLAARRLDINDGPNQVAVLHELDAENRGIHVGDMVSVWLCDKPCEEPKEYNMTVQTTKTLVDPGQIGIFADDWDEKGFKAKEPVRVKLQEVSQAVQFIRQKIRGETLNYEQMYGIIRDIANHRLSQVLATYFLSAFYTKGFSEDEIYFMTKAMAETGEMLKFPGQVVADKHSIGGVGGKGVTPIVVSIAMAAGLLVPNTSTKAITTASATTDMLESIMPMTFNKAQLESFVEKVRGFMVWGGGLDLAPADDVMIQVEKPLHLESFDKFTASIIAKKVAQGVNHLVIDLPKGPGTKVKNEKDVNIVKHKFISLARKFDIKIEICPRDVEGIDGNAVGPLLEAREFLYVLERDEKRSEQLEDLSIDLAARLLELAKVVQAGNGVSKAKGLLDSGKALETFKKIYEVQGGKGNIASEKLRPGKYSEDIVADEDFEVAFQNNKDIFKVCRALGNPYAKKAGIYFYARKGAKVKKGDKLATMYAESQERLDLAKKVWEQLSVFGRK